jgi:hypothetical protein
VPYVRRFLRSLLAAGGLTVASFALPGIGQAQLVTPASCTPLDSSQPFLQWGDTTSYELVPGGDFEGSLDGWTLQGGASLTSDSEPFGATGSVGSSALELPAGAIVTAPPVCVNVAHPDARLFVRAESPGATLTVKALYDTGDQTVAIPAGGKVKARDNWQPSKPLKVHPVVLPVLSGGGNAYLTLQFKASHGAVVIDDVFLDPWGRY